MDIHSRIKARRVELGLDLKTLADQLGMAYQTLQQWERPDELGGTAPSRKNIKKVADQLKTTVIWLTDGIGATVDPNDKYAFIPRYDGAGNRGPSVKFHDEIADHGEASDTYAYRKDYLAELGVDAASCRVVITNDDSMALGRQLLVNLAECAPVSGKVYALATANGVMVRRLMLLTDGRIELRADHQGVSVETYDAARMVPVIGRVIAFQGTLL